MSNQYRLEQDRDLLLLLDAGRLSAAPLGPTGMNVLDACLDAAVALGFVADELGDRTGTLAFDQEVRVALKPRRAGGQAVARALFDLQPRPLDSDYELAFRRAEGSKRTFVVLFTDLLEESAARPLVEAVPVLSRRHVVVVASPSDPALAALAAGADPRAGTDSRVATSGSADSRGATDSRTATGLATPLRVATGSPDPRDSAAFPASPLDADPLVAARAMIATDVLEARARVAAQVRAAGARVLEAPPERLPALIVAAYLRAKSRAVL